LSVVIAIGMFLALVVVMSIASVWLTNGLKKIGARLRFREALLGILTALGADAPEITSAIAVLYFNHHDLALGVVLGSNIFNLAGLLGLSALVAGRVEIGRHGLLVNGGVGLLVTVVVGVLIMARISPWLTLVMLMLLLVPYLFLASLHPQQLQRLSVPAAMKRFLAIAVEHAHRDARKRNVLAHATWKQGVLVLASLVLIVAASSGMVRIAVTLANRWNISQAVVGTLVLAALTSIPNVAAAVHLAWEGRGAAVISETFNSNTINAVIGICLPALVFGLETPSKPIEFSVFWLIGMSVVALTAASFRKGLHRVGGGIIIGLYVFFAAVIVLWR